ncbi:MAG TPA: hypothetical protein PLF40_30820 [Kofleriaceae bacterium]|nr:hypothetical protein [Kofleriaceae bacterium]
MKRSDLPIASPCNKDWDTMTPAGRKRFCSDCKKHVHDLSCMSQTEARSFLNEHVGETLCVRYAVNNAGDLLFAPRDLIAASSLLSAVRTIAAAAAVGAAGYAYHASQQPPAEREYTMGAVAMPTEQAAEQPTVEPWQVETQVTPVQQVPTIHDGPPKHLMGAVRPRPEPTEPTEQTPKPKHRRK